MHIFKRFYLLSTILAAFLIPLVILTEYVEVTENVQNTILTIQETPIKNHTIRETTTTYVTEIIGTLYAIGVLIFGFIFLKNLSNLIQRIRKNPKHKSRNIIFVLLGQPTIPHTFFNYIFLNQQKFEAKEIPNAVLLHEETHAKQKHSLDLLFISLLQIVFWFNPLLYFIKKSVKLNHEFLADQAVLKDGTKISEYQRILLTFSSYPQTPTLAHSLNYSSLKKRFILMKTHTSKRTIWLRSLLILPLLSLLIVGFSVKQTIQKRTQSSTELLEKATESEIKEFNTLAKKYNAKATENRAIPLNDMHILETIYKRMTHEQRAAAEAFPQGISKMVPQAHANKKEQIRFVGPITPPTPNPNPVEYIKELARKGAIFYIGPHKYSTEEAIELARKSKIETTIDVSQYPDVRLGGC